MTYVPARLVVLGLTACLAPSGDAPPDAEPNAVLPVDVTWPDGVPADVCRAVSTRAPHQETYEAQMIAPGRPSSATFTRDGELDLRWTYAYDAGGRLVAEELDRSGSGAAVDGVIDLVRTVEHTPTQAIERYGAPGGASGEASTWTLDAQDRVVRHDGAGGFSVFQLRADGLLEQEAGERLLPEQGTTYAYATLYTYDADGRLHTRGEPGDATPTVYEHDVTDERMIIRRTSHGSQLFIYTYAYAFDAQGRVTRATVDEDDDGNVDWRSDVTYRDDGAVAVTSTRDGITFSVDVMSAGCRYRVTAPRPPRSGGRPQPGFGHVAPMPNAYE